MIVDEKSPDFDDVYTEDGGAGYLPGRHSHSASTAHLLETGEQNPHPEQASEQASEASTSYQYEDPYRYSQYDDSTVYAATQYGHETGYAPEPSTESFSKDDQKDESLAKDVPFQSLEYSEAFDARRPAHFQSEKPPSMFQRYFGLYPLEQRIADKKRGVGVQRYPVIVWALTAVMLAVLIYELVVNARAQGSPVSFKPVVNPMLGPSEYALINLGARFPPCMKSVQGVPPLTTTLPCLNDTANPPDQICPLEDICGFDGFDGDTPNQWFRFITPVFLHAGIVHYVLNMLAQLTVSAQVEREMGSLTFIVLYVAAGIFGNVLGGNFALVGTPSVGASGAIFGTTAVAWIDLFAHWKYQYRPVNKLVWMIVELVLGVALGFIPYVDNFAHLGGLLMGLLVAMMFYPIISASARHRSIIIIFRLAAAPLAVVLFVVLIRNFYTSDPYAACSWCRYLSCIPTSSNNHCQGTGLTSSSSV